MSELQRIADEMAADVRKMREEIELLRDNLQVVVEECLDDETSEFAKRKIAESCERVVL